MALGICTVKILVIILPLNGIGQYFELRRLSDLLVIIFTLNIGIGIVRYLPYTSSPKLLLYKLALFIIPVCILLILIGQKLCEIDTTIYNCTIGGMPKLIITGYIISAGLLAVTTDILRGLGNIKQANNIALSITTLSFVLICLQFYEYLDKNLEIFIIGNIIINVIILIYSIFIINKVLIKKEFIKKEINHSEQVMMILKYSIARFPSSFLYALIFAWPFVFEYVKTNDPENIASIGIIFFIIKIFDSLAYPFNYFILPYLSNKKETIKNMEEQIKFSLNSILMLISLTSIMAPNIIKITIILIFGNNFNYLADYSQSVAIAGLSWMIFILLRGILDYFKTIPYSILIAGLGLLSVAIIMEISENKDIKSLIFSINMGMVIMAILSYILIMKYGKQSPNFEWIKKSLVTMIILKIIVEINIKYFGEVIDKNGNMNYISAILHIVVCIGAYGIAGLYLLKIKK